MRIYDRLRCLHGAFIEAKRKQYLQNLKRKGLTLGENVEIVGSFFFDPSHCFLISIGDCCTICPNVRLIAHDASTKKHLGYTKIGRITIKARCFIGDSVIVLPSVAIGPDVIVGAGSVVVQDIPPNTVAAGNPARVVSTLEDYLQKIASLRIRTRVFSEEYYHDRLDDAKRREILDSLGDSFGFIV